MSSRTPLVSVIVPTHNRATLIGRAVESILRQTYTNLEIFVVDDASKDDTAAAVKLFADTRVHYLRHEKNKGASAARNTGIADSHGELIAFLDDDDEWLPEKLAKQVPVLVNAPPEIGLVYCWMDHFDRQGKLVGETHPTLKGYVFEKVIDRPRLGGCPTLLVRRSAVERVRGFDEDLPRGNDSDFVRRVCRYYSVDVVPEVLVRVHVDHGGERISRLDEQGVRNALKSQQTKLEKFGDILPKYPGPLANIYASVAYHQGQLHQWRAAMVSYFRAIRVSPFEHVIYRNMVRTLRDFILLKNLKKRN